MLVSVGGGHGDDEGGDNSDDADDRVDRDAQTDGDDVIEVAFVMKMMTTVRR